MAALLALVALAPAAAAAGGVFGTDVSEPHSEADFACLKANHSVAFVIVRCYQSLGRVDPACAQSIRAAQAAGIDRIDVYHFPHKVGGPIPAAVQVNDTVSSLKRSAVADLVGTYWLDVERCSEWSDDVGANLAFIGEMVGAAQALGMRVGIYSGRYSWPALTGNTTAFSNLPLWYAHYEKPQNPSFSDYGSGPGQLGVWGGWNVTGGGVARKQYAGDYPDLCGLPQTDLDWEPAKA